MEETKKLNFHQILWYFIIFSIIGLLIETLFCYFTSGVIESRKGLLWGPFCPVYGVGAVIFNDLANNRVKDEIFDWDTILNFQGETGPYIQYTYVRTKSVIEKAGGVPDISEVSSELLQDEYSIKLLKLIYDFEDVLVQVTDKNEPSILSRYLIDVAKTYSNFYNENKIINDNKNLQNARVYLTYSVGRILKTGAGLLGIEMPNKM